MARSLHVAALAGALFAAGCSQEAPKPAPTATPEAVPAEDVANLLDTENAVLPADAVETADAVPASMAQCKTCHSFVKDGKAGIGPNLWDVAGKPAGQKAGFPYSDKLEAAALTWDDATLDRWLAKPTDVVPGTKMVFAGYPDPAKRQEAIAYLKTLK